MCPDLGSKMTNVGPAVVTISNSFMMPCLIHAELLSDLDNVYQLLGRFVGKSSSSVLALALQKTTVSACNSFALLAS